MRTTITSTFGAVLAVGATLLVMGSAASAAPVAPAMVVTDNGKSAGLPVVQVAKKHRAEPSAGMSAAQLRPAEPCVVGASSTAACRRAAAIIAVAH